MSVLLLVLDRWCNTLLLLNHNKKYVSILRVSKVYFDMYGVWIYMVCLCIYTMCCYVSNMIYTQTCMCENLLVLT